MPVRSAPTRSPSNARGAAFLAVLLLFVAGCSPASGDWRSRILPDRVALRSALDAPDEAMLRQVYANRGFQPIWMGGEPRMAGARELVGLLAASDADGLDPAKYGSQALGERVKEAWRAPPRERARTELMLTAAYVEYVHDLHTPAVNDDLAYTDRDLQPSLRDPAEIARQLAAKAWPQTAVEDATTMNGLYVQMRDALAQLRSTAPRNDPAEARLLLNLDRLRALPSKLGDRFVLVDVAANRLWLYQDNQPVDSMKVVVGAPNEQTPQMAALIRYAIYNPFWNVPPDLTRDTYAPRIAANLSALADLRMDAWSGFTPDAKILNPRAVDWKAVARGQAIGWLRQRPGPANSMGAAKFMLPNELGIYLHDTPHRELFDKAPRFFSAGCIRVEDYRRLSRWLFDGVEITAKGAAAEQRFDLPTPVPVYIVYLTARAEGNAVTVRPDVYGRDSAQPTTAVPPPAAAVPAPAATPSGPALETRERSPGAAEPARPAPSPKSAAAPSPLATAATPRSPPAQPAASPAPPLATRERSPAAAAPLRPAPPPQRPSAPAPAVSASAPKVQAARPAPPVSPAAAVVAQPPPPAPAPAAAPITAVGGCRVQAGVFSQRANADNLVKAMRPLGDARLTEVRLKSGAVAYSVVLAGLPSRKDAESALSRLNSVGGGKLGALRITGCPATAG